MGDTVTPMVDEGGVGAYGVDVPTATGRRRAPAAAERQRDAERTRRRIVDAALSEFSENGYAGARVRGIAERAGVNTQLISYYFGGKEGLFQEILRRWHQRETRIEEQNLSLGDTVVAYLEAGFEQPELTRIFIWEGLTGAAPPEASIPPGTEAPEVADFRRRQAEGEIAADLDPAYVLLAFMGAVVAPATMPLRVAALCGLPSDSDEFRVTYAEQLRRIAAHLAETTRHRNSDARRP